MPNLFQIELVYTSNTGEKETFKVFDFEGPGISLAMYNTDESIRNFAHSSFQVNEFFTQI